MPTSFLGDNIIYKYLDSNLFVVSTLDSTSTTISIYIINGVSGKIVYKFKEQGIAANEPIDMFLNENYLILAFRRSSDAYGNLPKQEISVSEFFQSREEADTMKLLKDFYVYKDKRLTQRTFSSFEME